MHVAESAGEVRGRFVVGPTKTGRVRTITLPGFLVDMLAVHLGRYPSAEGYVFTAAEGGPVRHRNFYARHYRLAVARAGLPPELRFHDLRRCARIAGANVDLGRSHIRILGDRQPIDGAQSQQHDENGDHPGENRAIDENA